MTADRDKRRRTGIKVFAFAGLLAVVFAAAAFAGSEVAPEVDTEHGEDMDSMHATGTHGGHEAATPAEGLPGLAVASNGYRLKLADDRPDTAPLRFRIVDAEDETVTDFDTEHARRMHLIVVRRDFADFQHLHPHQRADGTWIADDVDLGGGVYRMFTDFSTGGESLTLGADLFAPGAFEPAELPAPRRTAGAGDGYEVSVESAPARAGETDSIEFTVSRDGKPVDGVEPYLGADGHLVALREHDQAFLHVHPEGEPGGSGPIAFEVTYPTPGRYRLFLQFKNHGKVRTAAFTQVVASGEEH